MNLNPSHHERQDALDNIEDGMGDLSTAVEIDLLSPGAAESPVPVPRTGSTTTASQRATGQVPVHGGRDHGSPQLAELDAAFRDGPSTPDMA